MFPAEQGIIQLINADGVFGTHRRGLEGGEQILGNNLDERELLK